MGTGYDRSKDPRAAAPETRPSGLEQDRQTTNGNSLQQASRPLTSMGDHTSAPNMLPAPSATAGATMGSKPGKAPASNPGTYRRAF